MLIWVMLMAQKMRVTITGHPWQDPSEQESRC